MAKFKQKPIIKFYANEKYTFKGAVAKVPGTSMTITLKEFNKLKKEFPEVKK